MCTSVILITYSVRWLKVYHSWANLPQDTSQYTYSNVGLFYLCFLWSDHHWNVWYYEAMDLHQICFTLNEIITETNWILKKNFWWPTSLEPRKNISAIYSYQTSKKGSIKKPVRLTSTANDTENDYESACTHLKPFLKTEGRSSTWSVMSQDLYKV